MQFVAKQKDRDCYNNIFAEYTVTYPTWSSSDPSVADFYGANGVAYALDVGDALITATWEAEYFLDSGSDTCDAYPVIAALTGGMIVIPPTVTASFTVVGKDQTRTVNIQVANNPNHKTIAFSIRRTQGNAGAAEIVGNSTTSAL